ncbi:SDR family NAD(P)-dependent oxidoreductase [Novosphingobium sp. TH158]|uniref:SDR family NAD(P)-dependent oxidoreductase n=1 Tax=Novosphingobium sp. TH158 TaxID=2067455 RepID=UPI000C7B34E0|nr:SDR family oxidoreductase [Novosphingobium sp. TH158]PLK25959.1 oxidoreductase [Novosphingobium sp. TH158]
MDERFIGKAAIVTGAARGIGLAIAEELAGKGACVLLADIDGAEAGQQAQRLASGGARAVGTSCDVGVEAEVERCVATALSAFGRIDMVVNNAGIMIFKPIEAWSAADWLDLLRIDLIGAAMFTREAFRHMGEGGGVIVNVASVHALRTSANAAPYAAAKAALLSLTRSSAIEGKARNIRANAVLPGAVETAMLRSNPNVRSGEEVIEEADLGQPQDIARAVAFLASEEAAFISGAALVVDGGRMARL